MQRFPKKISAVIFRLKNQNKTNEKQTPYNDSNVRKQNVDFLKFNAIDSMNPDYV